MELHGLLMVCGYGDFIFGLSYLFIFFSFITSDYVYKVFWNDIEEFNLFVVALMLMMIVEVLVDTGNFNALPNLKGKKTHRRHLPTVKEHHQPRQNDIQAIISTPTD